MIQHTTRILLSDSAIGDERFTKERRRRLRVSVRWEIRFCAGAETLISTATENLSSDGFYCISDVPVATGDHHCVIVIPAHIPNEPAQALYLHCDVEVLRSDAQPGQRFGIAGRIRGYHAAATAP